MAPGLTIRLQVSGDKDVQERFNRAGDAARAAVVGVLEDVGEEIVTAARAASPSRRAASSIYYRVKDGQRDSGQGRIRLVVDTRRRMRWVQQFEEGTVGTGDDLSENRKTGASTAAVHGAKLVTVRSHTMRSGGFGKGKAVRTAKYNPKTGKSTVGGFLLVKRYERLQHMPTKPFMGPAFHAVEPTIVPRIDKAIDAAIGFDGGAP